MNARHRLPNRRPCIRHEFELNGFRYFGVIGFHPATNEPSEIFLQTAKTGTQIEAVARDAAVLASFALQHGATVDSLRNALTRLENGAPAGSVAALLDIVARNQEAAS